jgi:hypothetical protein
MRVQAEDLAQDAFGVGSQIWSQPTDFGGLTVELRHHTGKADFLGVTVFDLNFHRADHAAGSVMLVGDDAGCVVHLAGRYAGGGQLGDYLGGGLLLGPRVDGVVEFGFTQIAFGAVDQFGIRG